MGGANLHWLDPPGPERQDEPVVCAQIRYHTMLFSLFDHSRQELRQRCRQGSQASQGFPHPGDTALSLIWPGTSRSHALHCLAPRHGVREKRTDDDPPAATSESQTRTARCTLSLEKVADSVGCVDRAPPRHGPQTTPFASRLFGHTHFSSSWRRARSLHAKTCPMRPLSLFSADNDLQSLFLLPRRPLYAAAENASGADPVCPAVR